MRAIYWGASCRVKVSSEQLDILIRIGAFRFTGKNKYEHFFDQMELLGFSLSSPFEILLPSERRRDAILARHFKRDLGK